ncbi:MAG: hypothetical protein R3B47_07950 [Bacteroidia bacterium]
MKKLINQIECIPAILVLAILLMVGTGNVQAQTGNIQLDSTRAIYQPIWSHLGPNEAFADMLFTSEIFHTHRGDLLTDSIHDPGAYRQALHSLKNASVDYALLPDLDMLKSTISGFRNAGQIPIGIINYNVMGFRDSAFAYNEVVIDTITPQVLFTGPPSFQERRTVTAAAFDIIENTDDPVFIIPSSLFFPIQTLFKTSR